MGFLWPCFAKTFHVSAQYRESILRACFSASALANPVTFAFLAVGLNLLPRISKYNIGFWECFDIKLTPKVIKEETTVSGYNLLQIMGSSKFRSESQLCGLVDMYVPQASQLTPVSLSFPFC